MASTRVTVYFGTNRMPQTGKGGKIITGFGSDPGTIGGMAVRFGAAQTDVDVAAGTTKMVEGSLDVAPEVLTGPQGFTPQFGSQTIFEQLRQDMKDGVKPTLVFIHGFSNSFQDAIERAGWLTQFYDVAMNVFVFTWPSRGSLLGPVPLPYSDYIHDRHSAVLSGPAVARTLRTLYDFVDALDRDARCNQKLHLLCHSMGNYVLRQGLQALLTMPPATPASQQDQASIATMSAIDSAAPYVSTLRSTFDQIILAAADEDEDAFDDPKKLKYLPRLGNNVTVYHTQKDWILGTLSSVTKFNGPRLGSRGPDNMGTISDKVRAVDVSDILTLHGELTEPENHQYYRKYAELQNDIRLVLQDTPPESFPKRVRVVDGRYRLVP